MTRKLSLSGIALAVLSAALFTAGNELRAAPDGKAAQEQVVLQASLTAPSTYFGISVGISGNTAVIGSRNGAYVFVANNGVWSTEAFLPTPSTITNDDSSFGQVVAISGDTIAVGAFCEQVPGSFACRGAVYVFTRQDGVWTQQAHITPPHPQNLDFGSSLGLSGDTIVVGCDDSSNAKGVNGNENDTSAPDSGAAYVYTRSGTEWTQQAYLKASNSEAGDDFGISPDFNSVAIDGDTIVVTAVGESSDATGVNGNQNDNSAPGSGAAYVFVRSGGVWTQQAYLKGNSPLNEEFGWSVAISGDTIAVGEVGDASSATGVNGDPTNQSAPGSGAAFVFVRAAGTWTPQAYLKASNTDANDDFGANVAVSGDRIVVGSPFERSASPGVNGDQSDNSVRNAGAGYLFLRTGSAWSQEAYLKAATIFQDAQFSTGLAVSGDTIISGTIVGSGAAYVFTVSDAIPMLQFSNQSWTFSAHSPGQTSGSGRIYVTNTGTAPVEFNSIQIAGGEDSFKLLNSSCPSTLGVGKFCSVLFNFTPAQTGEIQGTLLFADNAPNEPQGIPLKGVGTGPALQVKPAALIFGDYDSPIKAYAYNSGNRPMHFSSIAFGGKNPDAFTMVSNGCGAVLQPYKTCSVEVRIAYGVVFVPSAELIFTSDSVPQQTIVPLEVR